jgi:DNA-binding transcriptional ArsR family regulator
MSVRTLPASLAVLTALVLVPAAMAEDEVSQVLDWTFYALDPVADDSDVSTEDPQASTLTVVGVTLLGPPPPRDAPKDEDASASRPGDRDEPASEPRSGGGLFGDLPPVAGPLPFDAPLGHVADLLGAAPLGLDLPLALPDDADAAPAAAPVRGPAPFTAAPAAGPASDAPAAPSAALVALASAAALTSVAAAPGFDWERVRRFGFVAALYARIAKDRLLDHARRETLLGVVRDRPGMTLSDVAEASGIPRNTATYHLNRLEKEGILTSARQGRSRLYFAVGGDVRKAQADAFAALRHDKARALALAVGEAPGVDQQALCARLGLAPSLVHWHADRLLAAGVLRKEREGRHVRYHPGAAWPLVQASEASGAARADATAC